MAGDAIPPDLRSGYALECVPLQPQYCVAPGASRVDMAVQLDECVAIASAWDMKERGSGRAYVGHVRGRSTVGNS